MLKKGLVISLVLFLLLPFTTTSFAQEPIDLDKDKEKRIDDLKIPVELLDTYDSIILEDILNSDELVEFESSSTFQWSESKQELELISITDQNGIQIIESASDESGFTTMGTIPSDKFRIYIDVYDVSSSNGRKRKDIYARYEWYNAPFWLLKDPFGISWSSKWRAVDNTSRNVDYYKSPSATSWNVVDDTTAIAYSGDGGVGWHADLYTWALHNTTQLKGYGKIRIETKSTSNPSGSDQLHVNYGHKMGTGTLSLTFGVISVNVSGSASHDTRGNYKTFSY